MVGNTIRYGRLETDKAQVVWTFCMVRLAVLTLLNILLTFLDIILRADNDLSLFGHLTRPTVAKIESNLPFNDAIVYAILHESIYCQG
jgi:hypothetical protein